MALIWEPLVRLISNLEKAHLRGPICRTCISLIKLLLSFLHSFMTTTFVIEAMAVANARLRGKKCEKKSESTSLTSGEASVLIVMTTHVFCLSGGSRGSDLYDITDRVEMGQMASMFFNKVGVHLFYICIVVYLYGDLAIYAAAVPRSLAFVACGKLSCNNISTTFQDSDFCWDRVTRGQAYRIFLVSMVTSSFLINGSLLLWYFLPF
uniref:Uncharacterized protein n=1 Tax=Eptatretus burgeri TaxID=7764 RepID=A0A8C4RAI3_EPTBU